MYRIVQWSIFGFIAFNFLIVLSFTIGPALLCPNSSNSTTTCIDGENFDWDTVSEMITREHRVRNGFAGFLVISALFIFCVVSLILSRLDFYYRELDEILEAAQLHPSYTEFDKALHDNILGQDISKIIRSDKTYSACREKLIEEFYATRKDSNLKLYESMSFYDEKKKGVWFVFAGAMIVYTAMGIWSTDKYTHAHTNFAKAAFTLLVLLCFLLNHLSFRYMSLFEQIMAVLSLIGCIVAGAGYVVSSLFWWEYVLIVFLHINMLSMTIFCVKLKSLQKPVTFCGVYSHAGAKILPEVRGANSFLRL